MKAKAIGLEARIPGLLVLPCTMENRFVGGKPGLGKGARNLDYSV
jgi:hypothetical protein